MRDLCDLCDFCWQHFVHIPEKKVGDLEIWIQQLFCFTQNAEVWFCHDRNYNAAWAGIFWGRKRLQLLGFEILSLDPKIEIRNMNSLLVYM